MLFFRVGLLGSLLCGLAASPLNARFRSPFALGGGGAEAAPSPPRTAATALGTASTKDTAEGLKFGFGRPGA